MNPSIEACWDWAKKREPEGINAPFDFFIYEDSYELARQLLNGLEDYFLDERAYKDTFYRAFIHYVAVTDYRVKYEDVWVDRPLGDLDRLPLGTLTPAKTKPASIPMTNLNNATSHKPLTKLNPSTEHIAWSATTPADNIPVDKESIPMTDFIPSITTAPMEVIKDSQRWVINKLYIKYDIAKQGVIYSSVSNGGSSTSVHMFNSLNDGDFLMSDLIRTPYGKYVYTILEQINPIKVLL